MHFFFSVHKANLDNWHLVGAVNTEDPVVPDEHTLSNIPSDTSITQWLIFVPHCLACHCIKTPCISLMRKTIYLHSDAKGLL